MKYTNKALLVLICFIHTNCVSKNNLTDLLKNDDIISFVDQIPATPIEIIQKTIHENIWYKKTKNNNASVSVMLNKLRQQLTNEIHYVQSQITNEYRFDRKQLKKAILAFLCAAGSTYTTFYIYKNCVLPAEQGLDQFRQNLNKKQNNHNTYSIDNFWAKFSFESSTKNCLILSDLDFNKRQKSYQDLKQDKDTYLSLYATAALLSLFTYAAFCFHSYKALTIDPNDKSKHVLKYQQVLKTVELLQIIES